MVRQRLNGMPKEEAEAFKSLRNVCLEGVNPNLSLGEVISQKTSNFHSILTSPNIYKCIDKLSVLNLKTYP